MTGLFRRRPGLHTVLGVTAAAAVAVLLEWPSGSAPTPDTFHPVVTPLTYEVTARDMAPRGAQQEAPVAMDFAYNWPPGDLLPSNGDGGLPPGVLVGAVTTVSDSAGSETTFCGHEGQRTGPPRLVLATLDRDNHVIRRQEAALPNPVASDHDYFPGVKLGVVGTGPGGTGQPEVQCGGAWGSARNAWLSQSVDVPVGIQGATYRMTLVMGVVLGKGARFEAATHTVNVGINDGQFDYTQSVQDVRKAGAGTVTLNGAVPSPNPRSNLLFFDGKGGVDAAKLVAEACGHGVAC